MLRIGFVIALLVASVVPAAAQYPERAVTIIVGYAAGGLQDIVARTMANSMKPKFPKGLVVVNRTGGGGTIASNEVMTAKPEGYSVLLANLGNLVIQPQTNDLPYKTPDDFEPIIQVVSFYPVLAVRNDAPWKTAQEFLAAAKASPGKIRVAHPGEGTSSHLNLEALKHVAGVDLTSVPFTGGADGMVALLGNHVEAIAAQSGEVAPHVEAKRMRVIAVFQLRRNPYHPDVPTWKEVGYDVAHGALHVYAASKGTPRGAVKYFHDAALAAMGEPAFQAMVKSRAIEADYRAGDALRAALWREYRSHTEILKRVGLLKK